RRHLRRGLRVHRRPGGPARPRTPPARGLVAAVGTSDAQGRALLDPPRPPPRGRALTPRRPSHTTNPSPLCTVFGALRARVGAIPGSGLGAGSGARGAGCGATRG